MISLADLLGFRSQFAPSRSNAALNMPLGPLWPDPQPSSSPLPSGFPGTAVQPGRMDSGDAFTGDGAANWSPLLPRLDALTVRPPPQDPGGGILGGYLGLRGSGAG